MKKLKVYESKDNKLIVGYEINKIPKFSFNGKKFNKIKK